MAILSSIEANAGRTEPFHVSIQFDGLAASMPTSLRCFPGTATTGTKIYQFVWKGAGAFGAAIYEPNRAQRKSPVDELALALEKKHWDDAQKRSKSSRKRKYEWLALGTHRFLGATAQHRDYEAVEGFVEVGQSVAFLKGHFPLASDAANKVAADALLSVFDSLREAR